MSHVQKRLVTTAAKLASLSATNLAKFPPKDVLIVNTDIPQTVFNPETWASLQPPPSPALSAFAHRIGLASILTSTDLIQQACTHPSFTALHSQHYPREQPPTSNAQLAILGNSLLGLFATEYLNAKYPYLPTRVQKAALTAHVGPATCANIAQEMGATPLVRWHRTSRTPTRPSVLHSDALASVPRALTALVYQHRSLPSARQFVHSYFLSRQVDLRGMLKFLDPKKALLEMVKKFDREKPKSRLLKETGRFSNSPIFVVGIFSGADQLGEGFGSSLKMAEFRAAEDALHRVYLTQTPDHLLQLPTSTFSRGLGDIFHADAATVEHHYVAPELTTAEIVYASSGKSKVAPIGHATPPRMV